MTQPVKIVVPQGWLGTPGLELRKIDPRQRGLILIGMG